MQEVYAFFWIMDALKGYWVRDGFAYWAMGNGTYQLLRLVVFILCLSSAYLRLIFG